MEGAFVTACEAGGGGGAAAGGAGLAFFSFLLF